MPPRQRRGSGDPEGRKPRTIAQLHAEWVSLLRPDGPFIAVPVLGAAFPQGLDTIPGDVLDKVRQAWAEVQEAPDLLTSAWCDLVLREVLRYSVEVLAEGGALPGDLRTGPPAALVRPDAVVYGPDGGGRAERLLIYRRPAGEPLTTASRDYPAATEQAANLCRHRGTPLALLTNGQQWALVHARPDESATTAVFDPDLWLEERDLLRAFASLLGAQRVVPPPKLADGSDSTSLAGLFARSAAAQAEVTDTLGTQVRQAAELLVGELSRLDRESAGALLGHVAPRQVYRGALTVMMRLVFLLYAEEQRLLPVASDLYASAYSVGGLYGQLDAERNLYGDEVGDRRAAAWPRLLATFAAVHGGCEYEEMRIPAYDGSLFDPDRYPWLDRLAVTDRVVREILGALLVLRRRGGAAERLSYKGLDVEQIGHVYEGLLEFSCLRVSEPYLGLIGKLEPELPLAEVEQAAEQGVEGGDDFFDWLARTCGMTPAATRKAMGNPAEDLASLHAACDNNGELAEQVRPFRNLLRRDLRGLPTVFPAGSLLVAQVSNRRATGTHYTPRPLAEEIVRYTLEPLCLSPGPADGADPAEWQVRSANELLGLKVLDPAMGSGAFLVSACRYLAEHVVRAWERDGLPNAVIDAVGPSFSRDDLVLEAKRRVAAGCLYGVDRDEAAVELCKLSLWIVTLAKDKPFSFLDHALRCGDSLVGLISESQVAAFHLDPETGHRINARLTGAIDEIAGPILTRVRELREEIRAEPVRDPRQGAALAAKNREANRLTASLRASSNTVVAAALSTAGQSEDAFDGRLTALSEDVQNLLAQEVIESPLERAFRKQIDAWLKGPRAEPIRPLHWALEFPEVMRGSGFDAVVSNPPFMGGLKLTGRLGDDLREYLIRYIGRGKRGSADLCSYFLLRNMSVAPEGRVGIIATNTIAQGDTREVGLDQAADIGWSIYRAEKSQPWPGTASLEVSLVWVRHAGRQEPSVLDGNRVSAITPLLDPRSTMQGNPYHLTANQGQSFQGSNVLGTGFILEPEQAQALLAKDPRNEAVLFPYLNGEDLNSRWDCSASRWVINFHDWPVERAQQYPDCFAIVERLVKPDRAKKNDRRRREIWWRFTRPTVEMYRAIADLDRVLVIAIISRLVMPAWVTPKQVLSNKLGIFATNQSAHLALLSSMFHTSWAWRVSSTIKADLNYSTSDIYETLPQPQLTDQMDRAGDGLDVFRREMMERRRIGLTTLYNDVHDKTVGDDDIVSLREIHREIDETVREAYALDEEREPEIRAYEERVASAPLPSWRNIELGHGFHQTRQGVRFTISPGAREDVLDKLLALNHYRYEQEEKKGLHSRKGRAASKRRGAGKAASGAAPAFDDGGLFPPGGTLF